MACASPQPKFAPCKLRSTCELAIFERFLHQTSAAGLAPSKRGGTKRSEKGRSQAACVRISSASQIHLANLIQAFYQRIVLDFYRVRIVPGKAAGRSTAIGAAPSCEFVSDLL